MFRDSIFKAYDIRGEYGKEFDADFALQLGGAFVGYTRARRVLVARDGRGSSAVLGDHLIRGLSQAGVDVIDIGMTSVPLFYFALSRGGFDGGIMVTASHLGPEFNGFKLVGKNLQSIFPGQGMEEIRASLDKPSSDDGKVGNIERKNYLNEYADFVIAQSGIVQVKKETAFWIEGPGVLKKEVELLLSRWPVGALKPDADLVFHFDSDADRLRVEYQGQMISADKIAALLIFSIRLSGFFSFFRKPTLVHDFRFSHALITYLNQQGIRTVRSRVGRVFIQGLVRQYNAEIGAELSGHICFKEMQGFESSLLAMLKLIVILDSSQKKLPELLSQFPVEYSSDEVNIPINPAFDKKACLAQLSAYYKDMQQERFDGLSIDFGDWWLNVRFSNTELILRLIVNGPNRELVEQKVDEIKRIIA